MLAESFNNQRTLEPLMFMRSGSRVQCSAVQYKAVYESAVHGSSVWCSIVQVIAVQCIAVHCKVFQCISGLGGWDPPRGGEVVTVPGPVYKDTTEGVVRSVICIQYTVCSE